MIPRAMTGDCQELGIILTISLRAPTIQPCPVTSINNLLTQDTIYLSTALSDKLNIGCMSAWGGPVQPYYCLGGFIPKGESFPENPEYQRADAVVMTIIIDNFDPKSQVGNTSEFIYFQTTLRFLIQDPTDIRGLERAEEWEKVFVEFMHEWEATEKPSYMEIAFNSERSIEDELDKETYGDIVTIAISYIIMFVYITFSLGQINKCQVSMFMIESKITLGLGKRFKHSHHLISHHK